MLVVQAQPLSCIRTCTVSLALGLWIRSLIPNAIQAVIAYNIAT